MPVIKVRATTDEYLSNDIVPLPTYAGYNGEHFGFKVSPKGTADADVVETQTGNIDRDMLKAEIEAMRRVTIQNNPKWDDVKTDTNDDGVSDSEPRANWAEYPDSIYEVLLT